MAVDVEGEGDVAVAEAFADDLGVDACLERRGLRAPQGTWLRPGQHSRLRRSHSPTRPGAQKKSDR